MAEFSVAYARRRDEAKKLIHAARSAARKRKRENCRLSKRGEIAYCIIIRTHGSAKGGNRIYTKLSNFVKLVQDNSRVMIGKLSGEIVIFVALGAATDAGNIYPLRLQNQQVQRPIYY